MVVKITQIRITIPWKNIDRYESDKLNILLQFVERRFFVGKFSQVLYLCSAYQGSVS